MSETVNSLLNWLNFLADELTRECSEAFSPQIDCLSESQIKGEVKKELESGEYTQEMIIEALTKFVVLSRHENLNQGLISCEMDRLNRLYTSVNAIKRVVIESGVSIPEADIHDELVRSHESIEQFTAFGTKAIPILAEGISSKQRSANGSKGGKNKAIDQRIVELFRPIKTEFKADPKTKKGLNQALVRLKNSCICQETTDGKYVKYVFSFPDGNSKALSAASLKRYWTDASLPISDS